MCVVGVERARHRMTTFGDSHEGSPPEPQVAGSRASSRDSDRSLLPNGTAPGIAHAEGGSGQSGRHFLLTATGNSGRGDKKGAPLKAPRSCPGK